MNRIYAIERNCIGCKLCEVACATEHSASRNMIVAMRQEKPTPQPLIHVQVSQPLSVALQCRHCVEPRCVYSCLTQALQKDSNGVVTYHAEYCIGCWTCMLACPYGAITRGSGDGKTISKCDLCTHRQAPACVLICPNEALVFGAEEEYRNCFPEALA